MRSAVRRSNSQVAVGFALASAALFGTLTLSGDAQAQTQVSVDGKGVAGGALLGGELGLFVVSATGAKDAWPYYVVPGLLAVGGGIGGYFIENQLTGEPAVPYLMMGVGMGLIIPAIIVTISANQYQPPDGDDGTAADKGASAPASGTTVTSPGAGTSTTTVPAGGPSKRALDHASRAVFPSALLNYDDQASRFAVGVPMMSVHPSYSLTEMVQFGVQQRFEVRAPLVALSF
jgi:hypothetical protein